MGAHAIAGADAPAERIEELTRTSEFERNLSEIRIRRRVRANGRAERWKRERIEDAADESDAIGCHRQRATQLAVAENRVRAIVIGGITEVELQELVRQGAVGFRLQLRMLGDFGQILQAQLLEEVGFSA